MPHQTTQFTHITYSWKFVTDCLKEKKRLPLDKYRLVPKDDRSDSVAGTSLSETPKSKQSEEPQPTKRARTTLSDRVTTLSTDLIVTFFSDKRPREVRNLRALRLKAAETGILEQFQKVVQNCRKQSAADVSELEVLRVLLRNKGDVPSTLRDFVL